MSTLKDERVNRGLVAADRKLRDLDQAKLDLMDKLFELFKVSEHVSALDGFGAIMPDPRALSKATHIVLRSGVFLDRLDQESRDRMLMQIGADLEYLFLATSGVQFRLRYLARCHWA